MPGTLYTSDGIRISYDHYRSGHKNAVVLAHGFYNSKQSILLRRFAETLSELYDVISFDFRGHGKSGGLFSWTSREYKDLISVLEFARKEYNNTGVVGFSMGGSTSIITAAKTDLLDSLVSIAAPSEMEKVDFRFWELNWENDVWFGLLGAGGKGKGVRPGPFWLKKEKPIELASKITVPALYIHGDRDWLVKPAHSQKLYDRTESQKKIVIIPNGQHAEYLLRNHQDELAALIREWFNITFKDQS